MAIFMDLCRAQHFLMSRQRGLCRGHLAICPKTQPKMLCEMRWEDTDAAPSAPLQLPASIPIGVVACFKMQGLHRSFQRRANLARLPEASVSNSAYGVQPVRQRDQRLEQPSVEPNLGLHAKTAFVLLHKLRCALTSNSATTMLNGDRAQFKRIGRSVLGHPPSRRWLDIGSASAKGELRQAV